MPSSLDAFQTIWEKCPSPLWYLCKLKLYWHTSSYLETNQQTCFHESWNREIVKEDLTNLTRSWILLDLTHLVLINALSMHEVTGCKGLFWIKLNPRLHCYTFWWQTPERKALIKVRSQKDLYCSTHHDFTASWTLLASGISAVVQPLARFSPSPGVLECTSLPLQRSVLNRCWAYWSAASFKEPLSLMGSALWMARRLLCCSRASRL